MTMISYERIFAVLPPSLDLKMAFTPKCVTVVVVEVVVIVALIVSVIMVVAVIVVDVIVVAFATPLVQTLF